MGALQAKCKPPNIVTPIALENRRVLRLTSSCGGITLTRRLAMSPASRSLATLLLAATLSAGAALLPLDHFGASKAWPHGGGDGGGNGNGGGNGKGDGSGHGNGGGAALGAGGATGTGASSAAATGVDPGHHGKGTSGSKGGKGST